jgi:LuxR family transcriptional regulator, maltose regulon positive regulatory protein
MTGPLLETKLHVPRHRGSLVERTRLSERLNAAAGSALTLVSAPAGFGKTTLLTAWLATRPAESRVGWLSLDHRDNAPALFWRYFVAALEAAVSGIGVDARALLQSAQPPIEAAISALINDLDAASDDVVLVLDDYHVIDARDVHDQVGFLLEHLPAHLHLILASRADPALPLARLRARGDLVEIRAADLRFTPDEAQRYLTVAMGLALTTADVAALEGRTEGWIAALQLAALSMQGRDDLPAFIAGFAGDDRYIVDYLAEEVLHRQPEQVQRFLLQTSILERMCGPLCDAVTGQDGGKAQLADLERGNLFLVPLDDRRQWYRYHQLFADVLQAHLLDERPGDVPDLHRRASSWYEHNGEPSEAIRHSLAGKDFARAADLVELALPAMRRTRQEQVARAWLQALPDEVIRTRPVLCVAYAGALLITGEINGVEERLRDAERLLNSPTTGNNAADSAAAGMVVVDQEEFRHLPGAIESYRAALALARGDVAGTVRHAELSLELSPDDDHLFRAAAAGLLGLAYWTTGELAAGHRAYAECTAGLYRAGHVSDTFGCAIALADIRLAQGRLGDAMRTYQETLQRAADQDPSALRGSADMHVGMSEVERERNDLSAALQQLVRSHELGEHNGMPQNRHRWRIAMARIREAEGDLDAALDLLNEADRVYVSDFFPNVRPIAALRARVWLAQGNLTAALDWARGLSVDDELSYLTEFDHITLARVLLAEYAREGSDNSLHDARRLLERLLNQAEHGERFGSAIEILVLQAIAHRGEPAIALIPLERALRLAEPQGYLRIFIDEGAPLAALLKTAAERGVVPSYVRRLLDAAGSRRTPTSAASSAPSGKQQGLIDPLSDREISVLRLLATDLGGPQIARELVVSLHTVRSHTKKIYAKLGVNNRREAVRRADELGLLPRARS